MTTKPEGPAPERCADCDECARMAYSDATTPGFFYDKCAKHRLPATPAPSQPTVTNRFCTRCGKLNDHTHEPPTRDRHDRPAFTGCCGTPTTGLSYVNPQHRADCPLRNAPSQRAGARECRCNCNPWCGCVCHEQKLAQQTAAKDALINELREKLEKCDG